jgi:two-component system, OmpR family, sensor histidine kinase VicK
LVVDNALSLTVELKDDSKKISEDEEEEATGLATYSNSNSTVLTYVLIFGKCGCSSMAKKHDKE